MTMWHIWTVHSSFIKWCNQLCNLSLGYFPSCTYVSNGPVLLVWQWEICSTFLPSLTGLSSNTTEKQHSFTLFNNTCFYIILHKVLLLLFYVMIYFTSSYRLFYCNNLYTRSIKCYPGRWWWPCRPTRRSAAARLLESRVRIPLKTCI